MTAHTMALRTPWYACLREGIDRFDDRAHVPVIQKYDSPEFVDRLLSDPRDSLKFDDDDRWGYPVPVPVVERGAGRLRFATHRIVRTGLRKLYQPSHDRFYAVVVELFCDKPGLPRPGNGDDVSVSFVMRRVTLDFSVPDHLVRRLARDLAGHLMAVQHQGLGPDRGVDRDVAHVLEADVATETFTLPESISVEMVDERWMTGTGGRARWMPEQADVPPGVTLAEQELPMWRLPPAQDACAAAGTRSLWFGLVPTMSSERTDLLDDPGLPPRTDKGALKLDDQAIYEIVCRARRTPDRAGCPPEMSESEPTAPFRLAPFFDPDGTRNHPVSITMPDLRTLAARAGEPPGPGGVSITSPPGSQLSFDPNGGTPKADGPPGGDVARVCTFALELFMIVAFFVFSLFLPIVVFLFQLWWMLALRFCLPPAAAAMALLRAHFAANQTLADLPPPPPPGQPRNVADRGHFDALVGATGATDRLVAPGSGFALADGADLFAAMDPEDATQPAPGTPEDSPPDPLCQPS